MLILNELSAYPWFRFDGISFRGYFIVNSVLYKGDKAIDYLIEQLNRDEFGNVLATLNGLFSIISEKNDKIRFATDRLRALPLFYAFLDGDLVVSDSANSIYDILPTVSFDPISVEDFTKNGLFVTGQNTMFNEIKQVQAGEWVKYKKGSPDIRTNFYFIHAEGLISDKSQDELTEDFKPVFKRACMNLNIALGGRTAVVSLSGGTDSRELLLMLHTIGYKKVLCFSYGKKGNKDCIIAEKLADHFGYRWIAVEYTRKMWRKLRADSIFSVYLNEAGNYTALPKKQDFLAVKILKERGLMPEDGVFLPGHAGAIIGGNLFEEFLKDRKYIYADTIELIKRKIYKCSPYDIISNELTKRIEFYFDRSRCDTNAMCEAQCHCFSMKERQAKFIINSVRVYEFFGYEWLLPLCDLEFLTFMKILPLHLKYKKKFIRDFMGLKSIASTSDDSAYKDFTSKVRSIPILRITVRKLSKLPKYFSSPMQMSGLYGFPNYFKGCIRGDEHFSTNELGKQQYLSLLKEKTNETD